MRRSAILILAVWGIAIFGCGSAKEEIRAKSEGEKTDVFHEVQSEDKPSEGFIDVVLKAQIKTHLEGDYLFEPKLSLHGKPRYPFLFNIDGQSVTWEVSGNKENTPVYNDKRTSIPDGGEGMRYVLEKKIRLRAGTHMIFFALPGEDYYKELELPFTGDTSFVLEFKPIYRRDRWISQNYRKGIQAYAIFLNGRQVGE